MCVLTPSGFDAPRSMRGRPGACHRRPFKGGPSACSTACRGLTAPRRAICTKRNVEVNTGPRQGVYPYSGPHRAVFNEAPSVTPPAAQVRILIADDHPIVRLGIRQLISTDPRLMVAAEADSCEGALRMATACAVNLAIVDLSLAGGSGLNVIRM